jgi:hypothetical protein
VALLGALSRLNTELVGNQEATNRAQQNKVLLDNALRLAESALAQAQRAATPPVAANGRPVVAPEPARVGPRPSEAVRAQLEAARARYFEEHPEVKRLRAQLADALANEQREDAAAAAERARLAASATPPPVTAEARASEAMLQAEVVRERERVATTRTQLALIEKELETRNAEQAQIKAEMGSYQSRVEKLPVREQQMAALTRDYETSKQNYQSLLDKKNSATMASDMERSEQSERFTVADPARVPEKPVKPRRELMYLLSSVGSLALCIVLAVGIEARKARFLGEWELPSTITVLGRIPEIGFENLAFAPALGGPKLLGAGAPSSGGTTLARHNPAGNPSGKGLN